MRPSELRDSRLILSAEAWVLMPLFAIALRVAPGRVMRRVLACAATGGERTALARRVAAAIEHAGHWLPARATACLPRACAAHVMLTQRGAPSTVRIGVLKSSGGPVRAHAWVEAGGLDIGRDPASPGFMTLPLRPS